MKINMNLNNDKQIGFNANVKSMTKLSDTLGIGFEKVAKATKGTNGDVVVISETVSANPHVKNLMQIRTEFNYFKKGDIKSCSNFHVDSVTKKDNIFDVWNAAADNIAMRVGPEKREMLLVEEFKKYMASFSK